MDIRREQSIKKYYENPNICKFCGKVIEITGRYKVNEIRKKTFCSLSCSAKYNNVYKKTPRHCINCGKQLKSTSKKYCSRECRSEHQYNNKIEQWKDGKVSGGRGINWLDISYTVRKFIWEKYHGQCAKCGWHEVNPFSNTVPLEIDHIDGDATNNSEDNLILLCPNCHSLTKTYRILNKGKGTRNTTQVKKAG